MPVLYAPKTPGIIRFSVGFVRMCIFLYQKKGNPFFMLYLLDVSP